VLLWDVDGGRPRTVRTAGEGTPFAAAVDAGGRRVAIGGSVPLVIQDPDGRHRVALRGHSAPVNALVFSPDGRHLLTGSDDGTARVWDARSGALERTLRGHDGTVRGVAYSADGRFIATAGSDATVRVWPAAGGEPVVLVGHEAAVNSAEFDDSGDRVVSAADDGTVRVWDAAGGEPLVVLYRHQGSASGADFGSRREVVSAGADGMRITPCEVCGSAAETLRLARTRATRPLTPGERRRLLADG
jgi:WD40 repeat protein